MPSDNRIDVMKYQSSISKEFIVLKDRVRSLIGSKHWGEEGRYKEIILMNFLRKHLPKNMAVGTGFIMDGNNYNKISSQIDLIIYDDNYPIIFKENDFIIVHSKSVLGIIEVKSKFDKSKLKEVIKAASDNSKLPQLRSRKVFNGIFYYDVGNVNYFNGQNVDPDIKAILREENQGVNHICFGENIFFRANTHKEYKFYEIRELSFSYFISNLIEMAYKLCNNYTGGHLDFLNWFLYPIEETKEAHIIDRIEIQSDLETEFKNQSKGD